MTVRAKDPLCPPTMPAWSFRHGCDRSGCRSGCKEREQWRGWESRMRCRRGLRLYIYKGSRTVAFGANITPSWHQNTKPLSGTEGNKQNSLTSQA
jgi:hypothetical protein